MSRRFRRRPRRAILVGIVLSLIVAYRLASERSAERAPSSLSEGNYQVERVIDGDTLLLTNQARVRLLGVDTPETVKPDHPVEPWGPEAAEFTRTFTADGPVRLQFDRERVDRYGRFLAYVWADQRLLNEELVRRGLARYEPQFRYSAAMKRRFRQAQDEARRAGRGIWSQS